MIWILGAIAFLGGGWVCIQSTTTRFAPAVMVAGGAILVFKMLA